MIKLPPGADIRTSLVDGKTLITIASPKQPSNPQAAARGSVTPYLTHPAGVTWPDRIGICLANDALEHAGSVVLEFASLADGLAFRQRLGLVRP